jgi:F420-dependent methylenetetrahydromethanopterin dehydrogenase
VVGLEFKSKGLRFSAANSNVAVGATLIVDGVETFVLERSGDLIVVKKSARSLPGGKKVKDIFKRGTSHVVIILNPNGMTSDPVTLSR